MKILFLSHYFPPEGNAPASRTYENAKRWVAAGHQVTVLTCVPNVPDGVVYEGYRNRLCQDETMDGVKVRRTWTYLAPNKGTVRRTLNYLSFMVSAPLAALSLERPDVVVATSPQFFCGWAGVIVSRMKRCPFVLEIRDIWPESIAAVGALSSRLAIRCLEKMEKALYRSARHVVTVGDGYRRRLLERGVPDEKISIVMNGVDRGVFVPRKADELVKTEWGLQGKFVCSYVGTIGMASGLEVVLRAARALQARGDHRIVFLLVGDGAVREDLQAQARAEGLTSIVWTGRQPKNRIPDFLAVSDACLVHLRPNPLFETVMPSKVFEAAGMKRPIINGVAGDAARWVTEAGAGVNIEPGNEHQLLAALDHLQAAPAEAARFGEAGYAYVTRFFDRDVLAARYLEVLKFTCIIPTAR